MNFQNYYKLVRLNAHLLFLLKWKVFFRNSLCLRIGRNTLLENPKVFPSKTSTIWIGRNTRVRSGCLFELEGGKVIIGDSVKINFGCSINSHNLISIGDYTIVGQNVHFYDHDHLFRHSELLIQNQGMVLGAISIGKNCWIGSNVTILRGVIIGDNSVIAAGSIVRVAIPENSLYVNGSIREVKRHD
jgi:acetyltransferase-like isoleucine patch superfamily enzyme